MFPDFCLDQWGNKIRLIFISFGGTWGEMFQKLY